MDNIMSSYRGTADRPDQAKAIAAVIAVHVALAAVILTGLNVRLVRYAVAHLTTIDIKELPSPPPVRPSRVREPKQPRKSAGAPAPKAEATPVVAPQPKLPIPTPIPTAKVAGLGSTASSGEGTSGTGTGASGAGNGAGAGGYRDYSRFTPARLIKPLRNRDYQALAANRLPSGSGDVAIVIGPGGRISDCRVIRSTGDTDVDLGLCPLLANRLDFSPARDDQGRPIFYSTNFHAQWSARR